MVENNLRWIIFVKVVFNVPNTLPEGFPLLPTNDQTKPVIKNCSSKKNPSAYPVA
jgi:hypothetical protein